MVQLENFRALLRNLAFSWTNFDNFDAERIERARCAREILGSIYGALIIIFAHV